MKCFKTVGMLVLGLMLLSVRVSAIEIIGGSPGNGGDTNPATFHFDSNNIDFQMNKDDGTALTAAEISVAYTTHLKILQNSKDFITDNSLTIIGADLSGANWTNSAFPIRGTVAVDPATGRFKFSNPAWQGAHVIDENPGVDCYNAAIRMNEQGEAFCFYREDSAGFIARANHYIPTSGWLGVQTLNATSTDYHTLDINDDGYAMFMWNDPGTPDRIVARQYIPGSGYQAPTIVDSGNMDTVLAPRMAMNNNGDVIYLVNEYPSSSYRVYANQFISGFGWQVSQIIDAGIATQSSYAPAIAYSNNGEALAVFTQSFGTFPQHVYANHFNPHAGGWQGPVLISQGITASVDRPGIAMNDKGEAVCVYYENVDSNVRRMWANHFKPGSGWGTAAIVYQTSSGTSTSNLRTAPVLNNAGEAVFTIQDDLPDLTGLLFRYRPNSGWASAETIALPSGGISYRANISINDGGIINAAFMQEPVAAAGYQRFYANIYYPLDGWQTSTLIDAGDFDVAGGNIANNNSGYTMVGFTQESASFQRVYANTFLNEIPGDAQVNYYFQPVATPTPDTALPVNNSVQIVNRKIEPLQGEQVSIQLQLASNGMVRIKLYTLQGHLVKTLANHFYSAGSYSFNWSADDAQGSVVASGVYIIRIQAPGISETQKVVVIK